MSSLRRELYTVLPAKSDSDAMFCLQSYPELIIDRSLQSIIILSSGKCTIDSHEIKLFLNSNCKQNNTQLSLLAGTTVVHCHVATHRTNDI